MSAIFPMEDMVDAQLAFSTRILSAPTNGGEAHMNETLTGDQFREQAEKALDGRKIDRETVRTWIHRGADRIDALTQDRADNGIPADSGSEAALMLLEQAREASEKTLDQVREMEAAASTSLEEARERAEAEAERILAEARTAAAELVAQAEGVAEAHVAETEQACEQQLNAATADADEISRAGSELQQRIDTLESAYRNRLATIRGEADSLFSALDRLDRLEIADDDPYFQVEEDLHVEEDLQPDDPVADLIDEIVDIDPDPTSVRAS